MEGRDNKHKGKRRIRRTVEAPKGSDSDSMAVKTLYQASPASLQVKVVKSKLILGRLEE